MTVVRREPLADQTAALLLERIRAGEWALGAKLPGETTLAPQFGVGRSTVREAISQLAGRGIVATRQGAGVFVTALDAPEDWTRKVGRADIRAVIEARIAIEVEASALAAGRRTPADLDALRDALEVRASRRKQIDEHVDADVVFHRGIVTAAHNPILLELFDSFTPRNREAMVAMLRARGSHGDDADHATHQRIHDAIIARDSDAAAAITRNHLISLTRNLGR
ncbi:FadR/GntR family transcriptional regulator [Tomitella cavernea]|uniref:FCD domain-containing protein n=1 Tax=Tomitella cavernea TaxID=1387982 RepID=A0ABP9CGG8_9ACTN|nr:FadR/GntR family transcriptional regulator [Tomitella cavernea]